ncbi:MAG: hypothetical protein A2Z88_02030 [Omnitrophica WOR_2 bacterium GWA2_47_8]|nr:MAG: hypothetical protein A2Z88_02030 [Omnitrophica WOR_2 bacterium GWA2_47_8]
MKSLIFIVCLILIFAAVKFGKVPPKAEEPAVESMVLPPDTDLEKKQKALKDQQQEILEQQRMQQEQRLKTYQDPSQVQQGM